MLSIFNFPIWEAAWGFEAVLTFPLLMINEFFNGMAELLGAGNLAIPKLASEGGSDSSFSFSTLLDRYIISA